MGSFKKGDRVRINNPEHERYLETGVLTGHLSSRGAWEIRFDLDGYVAFRKAENLDSIAPTNVYETHSRYPVGSLVSVRGWPGRYIVKKIYHDGVLSVMRIGTGSSRLCSLTELALLPAPPEAFPKGSLVQVIDQWGIFRVLSGGVGETLRLQHTLTHAVITRRPENVRKTTPPIEKTSEVQTKAMKNNQLGKFIIWNPMSTKVPKVVQNTYDEATRVAQDMARRHGGEFYVAELKARAYKPVVEFEEA